MPMYNISNHALERYAERIRGHNDVASITEYAANNREKIIEDINKMCEYGTEIYYGPGRPLDKQANQNVRLIVKDAWFVLVSDDCTVVTLFKKDFGVNDEAFNKQYSKLVVAETERLSAIVAEEDNKYKEEFDDIVSQIEENDEQISNLRKIIRQYEEQNNGLKAARDNLAAGRNRASGELITFINGILGKKVFD